MLLNTAGTTGRSVVKVLPNMLTATPTDIVYGVRAYRRAECQRHRNYRPCPPNGDGALSLSLALYVPPLWSKRQRTSPVPDVTTAWSLVNVHVCPFLHSCATLMSGETMSQTAKVDDTVRPSPLSVTSPRFVITSPKFGTGLPSATVNWWPDLLN